MPATPEGRAATGPRLLASAWTSAGDVAPVTGDEVSPYSIVERLEACAAAGFEGFGLLHSDLVVARDYYGYAELDRLIRSFGFTFVELEFLQDWWCTGQRRVASDAIRRDLLEATGRLGANHIKLGPEFGTSSWEHPRWVDELGTLADEFGALGAFVSLEFMPMCNVASLAQAVSLVADVDHQACGVLIDVWHLVRSGSVVEEIRDVPGWHIAGVELTDVAAHSHQPLGEESIRSRLLCGEGVADLAGFVSDVRATGWNGCWGGRDPVGRRKVSATCGCGQRRVEHVGGVPVTRSTPPCTSPIPAQSLRTPIS